MGLFEIFGESRNPGNVGSIEKNKDVELKQNLWLIIRNSILSIGIIGGIYLLIFSEGLDVVSLLLYLGVMAIYCVVGYLIIPKPDYDNIGWLGGLIDHPFRYSDDLNRILIFLSAILYPGRFIATTVMMWVFLLKKRGKYDAL